MTIAPVLTIAGSDSSGGAGIQADLKTMTMLGCFGMSAITALTAQNTTGVREICPVPAAFLEQQIAAVCEDIPPLAVKIGMVYDIPQIHAIAAAVRKYRLPHVVVDPVMVATSGDALLRSQAQTALTQELFPLAEVITPNLPEARQLTGMEITSPAEMEQAAGTLAERYRTAVLLKGGHSVGSCNDLLCADGEMIWISGERIVTNNTHGTGLYAFLGDCLAFGAGNAAGEERPFRKDVYYPGDRRRAVSGTRKRTDRTQLSYFTDRKELKIYGKVCNTDGCSKAGNSDTGNGDGRQGRTPGAGTDPGACGKGYDLYSGEHQPQEPASLRHRRGTPHEDERKPGHFRGLPRLYR